MNFDVFLRGLDTRVVILMAVLGLCLVVVGTFLLVRARKP